MCIYCGTKHYRKIYQNHYGEIPKESTGRRYDVHHIDGNHSNNDPANLKAVTIQEHYDIHYSRGDYGACFLIARKLELTPAENSKLCKFASRKRVVEGRHNLQKRPDGSSVSSDRVKQGKHPLLGKGLTHPKVDQTVYHFKNTKSDEEVSLTQYEFIFKYKLCNSGVCRLVKGLQKKHRNWILKN